MWWESNKLEEFKNHLFFFQEYELKCDRNSDQKSRIHSITLCWRWRIILANVLAECLNQADEYVDILSKNSFKITNFRNSFYLFGHLSLPMSWPRESRTNALFKRLIYGAEGVNYCRTYFKEIPFSNIFGRNITCFKGFLVR